MQLADTRLLLDAWDAGHLQRKEDWALTLLSLADPSAKAEELARLSIGERDARLLSFRTALFGPRISVLQTCPRCGAELDVELDAADFQLPTPVRRDEDFVLHEHDCELRFRLPESADLVAAADCADADQAQMQLLDRVVIEAKVGERPVLGSELPADAIEALSSRMSALDPQAELRLNMRCAACGHDWPVVFDVLPFLWCELNAWALRLLREVHGLASAYSWSEDAILSMNSTRRRRYLDMVGV